VTGTGGIGKTRLALRAAAESESAFPGGTALVELSALRDPELLAHTVAAVLGLPERDPRPRLEQVLDYLRERRLLLILDTCEHLVEACALFAEAVLTQTVNVTILATSRQPLDVAGEHAFPLLPLAVPPASEATDGAETLPTGGDRSDDTAGGDAVDLFAQRAAAVVPGFEVTNATRADIVRLCRHLDGIPLAIELAAGRLRELSLGELTERLGRRFADLTAAQRATVDRHQTLRDAIGWSYDLCTSPERALWERLSVFAGPFGIEAAGQACAGRGLDRVAVMETVLALVDKSVLIRGDGDASRYQMLDTIREYGDERLAASGIRSQIRTRHLRRYLGLAADLDACPLEHQVPRYRALAAEHADIRAALEHATTSQDIAGHPAIQLPAKLLWYWVISGRLEEGRYWLTRGLERSPGPGPDRIMALYARSFLACNKGEPESAIADAEAGTAAASHSGDRLLQARGLAYLAYGLAWAGRIAEGQEAAKEAWKLRGHRDDPTDLAVCLGVIEAYMCLLSGDLGGCLSHCERALRLMPPVLGERWSTSYLYGLAGVALCLQGKPREGNGLVLRGLAMKHELGDTVGIAHGLSAAALVAASQHRHERTAWLLGAADPLWEQIGSVFNGITAMQVLTEQAADEARAVLGADRYAELARDAAALSVDQAVEFAVTDADAISALGAGTGGRP
jgi:non-specific serine/threonine protein kinase